MCIGIYGYLIPPEDIAGIYLISHIIQCRHQIKLSRQLIFSTFSGTISTATTRNYLHEHIHTNLGISAK